MANQGAFYWNELWSSDLRKTKSFYGKLVGWKTKAMKMPGGMSYTMLMAGPADAPPAGGMYQLPSEGKRKPKDQWVPYVVVDDVDKAAAKVKKLGGKLKLEPHDIEGIGRICVITDPGGATIGLITPAPMPG